MSGAYTVRLTNGQRNALTDLISEHLRCPKENQTEVFVDASVTPAAKTTAGDLLRLISAASWEGGLMSYFGPPWKNEAISHIETAVQLVRDNANAPSVVDLLQTAKQLIMEVRHSTRSAQ